MSDLDAIIATAQRLRHATAIEHSGPSTPSTCPLLVAIPPFQPKEPPSVSAALTQLGLTAMFRSGLENMYGQALAAHYRTVDIEYQKAAKKLLEVKLPQDHLQSTLGRLCDVYKRRYEAVAAESSELLLRRVSAHIAHRRGCAPNVDSMPRTGFTKVSTVVLVVCIICC